MKFTGKMAVYMQWPLWLIILLMVGTVGMFFISVKAGVFMLVLTAVYGLIAWLLCVRVHKDIFGELVTYATQ